MIYYAKREFKNGRQKPIMTAVLLGFILIISFNLISLLSLLNQKISKRVAKKSKWLSQYLKARCVNVELFNNLDPRLLFLLMAYCVYMGVLGGWGGEWLLKCSRV